MLKIFSSPVGTSSKINNASCFLKLHLSCSSEKTGRKIRDAEISKIPYIIVIGEREEKEKKITVRKHGGENIGSITTENFIELLQNEIDELIKFNN